VVEAQQEQPIQAVEVEVVVLLVVVLQAVLELQF
jgi:hypothetical protein